ncbi:MAG: hypothetical protein WAN03_19190 [Candidatus Sulfotelmatobacter sp.]
MARSKLATLGFAIALSLAALRAYQFPAYTSDEFVYMANAVAMHGAHAPEIHETIYRELYAGIPKNILDHLLGHDPVETATSRSFHERAVDPYRFAEFLPCFAVRPIFNELVYVLHYWLGISLLHATVLIPVVSYWVLGWFVFIWISRYTPMPWAALVSVLLLLTPPVWDLARSPTPDALSCMTLLLALYLILEKNYLAPGFAILLASVYVRTDNALLVLTVIAYLSIIEGRLEKAMAVVLAAVAIASVMLINHFAGDYGARMLYYRAFIAPPIAPGEMIPTFGFHDYAAALRSGLAGVIHGDFAAFGLMGVIGLLHRPSRALLNLTVITVLYSAGRFVVFPLADARYFALFFVVMGILPASSSGWPKDAPKRQAGSKLDINEKGPIRDRP